MLTLLKGIIFNTDKKDPNHPTAFHRAIPTIVFDLIPVPAEEAQTPPSASSEPAAEPTSLQVLFVYIQLGAAPHSAFELCGVALWAQFAAITLQFTGLEHLQLISDSHRHETQLNTFNRAFRLLALNGKLKFLAWDEELASYGWTTDNLEPRLPGTDRTYEVGDLPAEVRGIFVNKIVPRMIWKVGTLEPFLEPSLAHIQDMLNELAEYRYHSQLHQNPNICGKLVSRSVF